MAIKAKKCIELAFNVPDRPGMLAEITGKLAAANINLVALLGWSEGAGSARMGCVLEDARKAKALAKKEGIELRQHTLFLIEGKDKVGALVELAEKLGTAGINITGVNAVATSGRYACLLRVDDADVKKVAKLLGV